MAAIVLFIGGISPSPLSRHSSLVRFGPDKLLHLVGHHWFAATFTKALAEEQLDLPKAGLIAIGVSTGYAIIIGKIQEHIPGRAPERADLTAAVLGSFLGAIGSGFPVSLRGWYSSFGYLMVTG